MDLCWLSGWYYWFHFRYIWHPDGCTWENCYLIIVNSSVVLPFSQIKREDHIFVCAWCLSWMIKEITHVNMASNSVQNLWPLLLLRNACCQASSNWRQTMLTCARLICSWVGAPFILVSWKNKVSCLASGFTCMCQLAFVLIYLVDGTFSEWFISCTCCMWSYVIFG